MTQYNYQQLDQREGVPTRAHARGHTTTSERERRITTTDTGDRRQDCPVDETIRDSDPLDVIDE